MVKAHIRQAMYEMMEQALRVSGVDARHRDPLVDRGDGLLALIHPVDQIPKTVLLTTFIPVLTELLIEHNGLLPEYGFRLRAAVHAGDVAYDCRGSFGEAIDITCRLLDAPEFKRSLGDTTRPLALVVSEDLHRSIIKHGYEGIDKSRFKRLVHVECCGEPRSGWVYVPLVAISDQDNPGCAAAG